ncbi:superoxide dismutase [Arcticibacter tournemirensis]|uniref:Superoxide dismutase n=2 Tax=Arcticibacter tournemirensis TaxID=699437 RepID=A0A4Q0M913_9SPHI|nr:superoxide dismutase [Arcticibacter tournemirensis]RXF69680.1 superoxide dismutase [Arcticibacter tournemirensis]
MKFKSLMLAGVLTILLAPSVRAQFTLPDLPYAFDALEPAIDKETMQIHHDKHHAGYVKNLNDAVKGTALEKQSIEKILASVSKSSAAVRNNAGGHYNHSLFWQVMAPNGSAPSESFVKVINSTFGSLDKFKSAFADSAAKRFGSGWAWLIIQKGKLKITTTPNQDNPLMDVVKENGVPILALDVWEHAYYLKYQNKRPDYISAWWSVVNWPEVERRYNQSK